MQACSPTRRAFPTPFGAPQLQTWLVPQGSSGPGQGRGGEGRVPRPHLGFMPVGWGAPSGFRQASPSVREAATLANRPGSGLELF